MIDYILDYLENKGIYIESHQQQLDVENGIKLYLIENGIDLLETRKYFKKYIDTHLALIDKKDLKSYFIEYPKISQIKQIAIEYVHDGSVASKRVKELYKLMSDLHYVGLGDKYVPAIEIREILGKYS